MQTAAGESWLKRPATSHPYHKASLPLAARLQARGAARRDRKGPGSYRPCRVHPSLGPNVRDYPCLAISCRCRCVRNAEDAEEKGANRVAANGSPS